MTPPPQATERRGYSTNLDDLIKRLRRIKGQVGGIERMVDEERSCIDIVTQISAAEAALDQVALKLLADHTATVCLTPQGHSAKSELRS